MTIITADRLVYEVIEPESQWDSESMDKFEDWEPHSNGQLFLTHMDPNPTVYADPRDNEGYVGGGTGSMLDDLPIGFGKKYPTWTPKQIVKVDPQFIVWCRDNTSRVFCSDEMYERAKVLSRK